MNERRWLNQYQPQTLVMGTMLCYLQAFFIFLFEFDERPVFWTLLICVGLVAGGYGIANEKKWGYMVAVGAALLQVAVMLVVFGADVLAFPVIIGFMFDVALVALLLHPQSRDYQKIWFS
ncbi:MAG: hypothetical protein FJW86_13920 [Actinobacteria bacterium]|nr:hypothetical protein [Actinomycetota bacterium]